jgi:hypothetical protein
MEPEAQEKQFSWQAALTPVLALGLGALFWAVFALENFDIYGPGVGVLLFVTAYFGCVLLLLGKKAHWTGYGITAMAASLVLALCCALYALSGLLILNCFLILFLAATATFCLSGQLQSSPCTLAGAVQTIGLSIQALFTRIERTFQFSRNWGRRDGSADRTAGSSRGSVASQLCRCGICQLLSRLGRKAGAAGAEHNFMASGKSRGAGAVHCLRSVFHL